MTIDLNSIPSPCYVIDEKLFRRNLELINRVRKKSGVEIILALKGFAMWSVFPIFKEYFSHATASSEFEAMLVNEELNVKAHTYAPAYTENTIESIARLSSHITFNSISQFERFKSIVKKKNPSISIGLRINPEWSPVGTDLYNPCAPGARLGILRELMPESLPDEIEGLHFHSLCESSAEDLVQTLAHVEEKFGDYIKKVKWINMGGGHLMTRRGYNVDLLIETLKRFREKHQVEVVLEPGAAFAWETGYLISTVEDVVENKGIKTALLDVSFTAHMPDCLEMPYKPLIIGALEPDYSKPTYRMGGNSCLSGDFMGDWSFDTPLKIGDKLVFNDMIHYTMVKTTMFNGVEHPSIGIWTKEGVFNLIRRFGYKDYKNRLS